MINKSFLLALFLAMGIVFLATGVLAQGSASYDVSAQVASKVSPDASLVKLNASETLADPVNHPILLTVTLLDKDNRPLANKEVAVFSDRGTNDIIEAVSKISSFKAQAANIADIQKDKTDGNGRTSFRITSFVSGESQLSIIADNIVRLPTQKVVFLPLPVPSYLSVSLDMPFSDRDLTLLPGKIKNEDLSPVQQELAKQTQLTFKARIPFYIFAVIILILLGLLYFVFSTIVKFRKLEKKDAELARNTSR